jgi:hypothetical protein
MSNPAGLQGSRGGADMSVSCVATLLPPRLLPKKARPGLFASPNPAR